LDILKRGGSAVDAAIATNAVLSVLEPMMNGLGGDIMVILRHPNNTVVGYNGAGRSSLNLSYAEMVSEVERIGEAYIPTLGPLSVTVPGAPQGWCDLHARYGRLPFQDLLATAVYYAMFGAPVPEIISEEWVPPVNNSAATSAGAYPRALEGFTKIFSPSPNVGTIFTNPALANTLSLLGKGGCDAFYKNGPIPQAILALGATAGLRLTAEDLRSHHGEWIEPVNTTFFGHTIFQLPPNPQGVAALEALNILETFNFTREDFNSADYLHAHIEAKKLAFADASAFFADPAFVSVPVSGLLSKSYAGIQRSRINMSHASSTDSPGSPQPFSPNPNKLSDSFEDFYGGDTTYLTTADSSGLMVSWIQSLYTGFGSGLVHPELGFAMQSRGALFSLQAGHPNVYAPGKRPFHTIMPGMASKNDSSWTLSFGVMGGFMQPQGAVQVLSNIILHGMNVQEAGDAARYYHSGSSQPTGQKMVDGGLVQLEAGVCDGVVDDLKNRGHTITRGGNTGGYQAILRQVGSDGAYFYSGGTEMRKDGAVSGY